MNSLMSLGQDGLWRRRAASALELPDHGLVLDVGTGTGALARAVVQRWPGARVIGVDASLAMLARALPRAQNGGPRDRLAWLAADGLRLPFADCTFDAVTSGFLLRNIGDLDRAFAETARVTRPAGRVVALEFSPEVQWPWGNLVRGYLHRVGPWLGALVAGDPAAYRYLPASIDAFATPLEVAAAMRRAGLLPLRSRRLVFGLVVIHVGMRLTEGEAVSDGMALAPAERAVAGWPGPQPGAP